MPRSRVLLRLVLPLVFVVAGAPAARADVVFTPTMVNAQAPEDTDIPIKVTGASCPAGDIRPIDAVGFGAKTEALVAAPMYQQGPGVYAGNSHPNADATDGEHTINLTCSDSGDKAIDSTIVATVHVTVTNGVKAGGTGTGTSPGTASIEPKYFNANRTTQDLAVYVSNFSTCTNDEATLHAPDLFASDPKLSGIEGAYGGSPKVMTSATDGTHTIQVLCSGMVVGSVSVTVVHAGADPSAAPATATFMPSTIDRSAQTPFAFSAAGVPCDDGEVALVDADDSYATGAFVDAYVLTPNGSQTYTGYLRTTKTASIGAHTVGVQCKGVFVAKGTLTITGTGGNSAPPTADNPLTDVAQPMGIAAFLQSIASAGGYQFVFDAPSDGFLKITWYGDSTVVSTHASASKRVLLAAAYKHINKAGSTKVKVALTRPGRKLFERARKVKLQAREAFYPTKGDAISNSNSFTLKRKR